MIRPRSGPLREPSLAKPARFAIVASLAAFLVIGGAGGAGTPAVPDAVRGTYRLHGTARVALGAGLARETEVHADALLDRGHGPRAVLVRVDAEGYACELEAQLDPAGALTFPGDQRCAVAIASPDARGHLDARLRSARGRVDAGHLTLELAGEVQGTLSRRTGGVRVLGHEIPATWTPDLPVRGSVEARAEGDLDRSRAAQR